MRMNSSTIGDLIKTEHCAVCHVTLDEDSYTLVSRDSYGSITCKYSTVKQYWDIEEPVQKAANSPIHDSPCTICVPIPCKAIPSKLLPLTFE